MKSNKAKSAMTALVVAAMVCTAAMPVKAAESQWINDNGSWSYVKEDGSKAKGWIKDNGCWYAFDDNGSMRTGWVASHEHWYFMGESGVMQSNAWVEENGARYFIKGTGVMAKDYVKDGYELTSDGKAIPLAETNSVVVTDPSAVEGQVIEGNLYVDVTTAKELELKGVTVKGKLVIIGDNQTAGKVTVTDSKIEAISTQTRNAEVVLSGETAVKEIVVEETSVVTPDKNFKGEVEKIEIQSTTKGEIKIEVPAQEVSTRTYASVDIQAPVEHLEVKTDTQVKVNADVKNVVVTESAKDTKVEVSKGNTVGTIVADAPVKIEGSGTIEKVEANVDGVQAGEDTVIKEVEKNENVTTAPEVSKPEKPSTGGGSTGGSGGGTTVTIPSVEVGSREEFNTAVEKATVKTKIVLTADIDLGTLDAENPVTITIPSGKNIILDLNGKTISGALNTNGDTYYAYQILCNNGTLTIEDSGTNGKIANTNTNSYICTRTVKNTGTMTINGGEIYSEKGNALINVGTLTINNGAKLTSKLMIAGGWTNGASTLDNRADLTINGGTFTSGNHVIYSGDSAAVTTINGGTFTATDTEVLYYVSGKYVVKGGTFNKEFNERYVEDGYYIDTVNGLFVVKPTNNSAVTVSNSSELVAAIKASTIKDVKIITVTNDITLNDTSLLTLAKNSEIIVNAGTKLTINSPIDLNGVLKINGVVDIDTAGYIGNIGNVQVNTNASLNYNATIIDNKITVSKPMDMQWVAYQYINGNNVIKDIKITNDLDYKGAHADPIGTSETEFSGTLDAKKEDSGSYTISNVNIKGTGNMALFGNARDISISNLNLANVTVTGNTARAGVLVAAASGNIAIKDVEVQGTVTASSFFAGGLIGSIYSLKGETVLFENCKTNINVTSDYNIGALWGTSESSSASFTIKNCENSGVMSGKGSIGIFAGWTYVGDNSGYENLTNTWSGGSAYSLFGSVISGTLVDLGKQEDEPKGLMLNPNNPVDEELPSNENGIMETPIEPTEEPEAKPEVNPDSEQEQNNSSQDIEA